MIEINLCQSCQWDLIVVGFGGFRCFSLYATFQMSLSDNDIPNATFQVPHMIKQCFTFKSICHLSQDCQPSSSILVRKVAKSL